MAAVLKYFDLSGMKVFGRGGVVRIFCETNGLPYADKDVGFNDEWAYEKPRIVDSNENPSGQLPVLYDGEFQLSECNAIMRYLARQNHALQDARTEAVSDMMLDKVVPLRDATIQAAFSGDDSVKSKHKEDRKAHYRIIDQILQKHATPQYGLISQTTTPTAGDVSVYCVAYDDARLHGTVEGEFPALNKLISILNANESIKAWLEKKGYGENPLGHIHTPPVYSHTDPER